MVDFNSHLEAIFDDPELHRDYAQNRVIVDVAVALNRALDAADLSQKELAGRLGKTEGYVSQVLSGGANMTLRTLGDFAYGLGCVVNVILTNDAMVTARPAKLVWNDPALPELESSAADAGEGQYELAA
jgi:transcriptional regulator with XRE-family HTH domain